MTETTTVVPATQTAIQEVPSRKIPSVTAGGVPRGLIPQNLDEVLRQARIAVGAGLLKNTEGDAIAMAAMIIMKGLELGMSPTVALDNIALINGRTCIYGKAIPALVRKAGHKIREWETGTRMADDWTFHCEITRGDTGEVITRSFSVLEAKQAQLWNQEAKITRQGRNGAYTKENDSPWYKYPQRMLPARAKGYAAADGCPEALLGMFTAEEMQDVARAEEAVQEEERGFLTSAAPPPPPLALESDEPPETEAAESVAPEAQPENPAGEAADPASEALAHPSSDKPSDIDLAAVSCASAMSKTKTVERLDQLMDAFNAKYDGEITLKMSTQLELIYNQNKDRIEKSA